MQMSVGLGEQFQGNKRGQHTSPSLKGRMLRQEGTPRGYPMPAPWRPAPAATYWTWCINEEILAACQYGI